MSEIKLQSGEKLYKQEGQAGLYQIMLPFLTVTDRMLEYLPANWGESFGFAKGDYIMGAYYEKNFHQVAEAFFTKAQNGFPPDWQTKWKQVDHDLTETARVLVDLDLTTKSIPELKSLYDELYKLDQDMWAISIFIDVFDIGSDQTKIEEIAKQYGFTDVEVATLLQPQVASYITDWEVALKELKAGRMTKSELKHKFFWYAINYSEFRELSPEFIKTEVEAGHEGTFSSPEESQRAILQKYKLDKNPLEVFQTLAVWRDVRKRLNYTGLYGLIKIAQELLRRNDIEPELINAFLPSQVEELFVGRVDLEAIRSQMTDGIFLHADTNGKFNFARGAEGAAEWAKVKEQLDGMVGEEVKGMVACKGHVTGRVRIVLQPDDEQGRAMQPGDILVSSMTRPEFISLMKKAGAIVTDEGGISCHAAIVARELNIPCIIGTKHATKLLHNGDMVEVDANSGVVRILS